jgi:hypothetical protein
MARRTFVPTIMIQRDGLAVAPTDLSRHEREKLKMTRQNVTSSGRRSRIRVRGEHEACKRPRQQSTEHRHLGIRAGVCAALAQGAANPFSSRWLMQTPQNNNWIKCRSARQIECRAT